MPIGTPTTIGTKFQNGVNSSIALTTTANIVSGDLVVVVVKIGTATGTVTVSSMSDGTNSYSKAVAVTNAGANMDLEIWYVANAAAVGSGGTLTATFSGATSGAGQLQAIETARITGCTSTPLDQTNSQALASSTTPSVATGTLAQAVEVAIGAAWNGSSATYTEASGFTNISTISQSSEEIAMSYDIVNATTAVTYAPSWSASGQLNTLIATFKGTVTSSFIFDLANPMR